MAKNSMSSSKNQEKKKGNRMCEKIFRAVTSPVRTVRRISAPNHQHQEEAAVRVKFSETTAKPITKMEQPKKKTLITRVETTLKPDETFTDYIMKAKLKIRATTGDDDHVSNAGETETRDHHHHRVSRESSSGRSSDRFSEYINKAKMKLKLRSSSTVVRADTTHDSW
ncbi:unnamed protein product [Eruca vesicaria subsp. sativa]|uniref:Uncharacterized protein n=1 Tax=Eruca vesicaria subsp. sativa TaxID=29727 RepID=A0ABC8JRU6_ERUVS|nr:unnamed protein product [Eruca vesicaria subsp. sativa]